MITRDIRVDDLIDNPLPRIPICLCLDVSVSMLGFQGVARSNQVPIHELNVGVQHFYRSIQEDEMARWSAEVAVVTFSGRADVVRNFESIVRAEPPLLEVDSTHMGTSLGSGVAKALELLEQRKAAYKAAGVEYFQPWLVVMTDGRATDSKHLEIAPRLQEMVHGRRLVVFPLGIGPDADMEALGTLSPKRPPLRLKGLLFKEFFEWLSRSVERTSRSQVGDEIALDLEGIKTWREGLAMA